MIFYPSGETKTRRKSQPWASLFLALLAVVGYFLVVRPLEADFDADLVRAKQAFTQAVERQYDNGKGTLEGSFWTKALEDASVVGEARNRTIFSEEVRKAYRLMVEQVLPLERLKSAGRQKILLLIAPHHVLILIIGCLALWVMGYLFEHLYDRLVAVGIFVLSGWVWLVLDQFVPFPWWPSPAFYWSYTLIVYLWVAWLAAPGAGIELTLRGWLGTFFKFPVQIPSLMVPIVFSLGLLFSGYFGAYKQSFSLFSLVIIPIEVGVFVLLLLFFARKGGDRGDDSVSLVNQQITASEILFGEERKEEGCHLLHSLFEKELSMQQLKKILNLAWNQDQIELIELSYKHILRKAIASKDFLRILEVIEEMVTRRVKVPGRSLLQVVANCLRREELDGARKLLPYLRDNDELDGKEVLALHHQYVKKIVGKRNPDQDVLRSIRDWLLKQHPDSEAMEVVETFYNKRAQANRGFDTISRDVTMHRLVEIELHKVGTSEIVLQIPGSRLQHVPWTAVLGIFGCHMAAEKRGFRGCIAVKFKRKTFGCYFTSEKIVIEDRFGKNMSFEEVWNLLGAHVPEDLPFTEMKAFEQIRSEELYRENLETFLNHGHTKAEMESRFGSG